MVPSRYTRLCLVLLVAAGPACAAKPPVALPVAVVDVSDAARAVEGVEREYWRVVATGDRVRQFELLADDYVLITPFGTRLDRAAVLGDQRGPEFVSTADDLRVRVDESQDTAILTMTAIAVHGKIEMETRTVRVWRRAQGQWRASFAQQTSLPGTPPNVGKSTADAAAPSPIGVLTTSAGTPSGR